MRAKVTLLLSLALMIIGVALTLTRAPLRIVHTATKSEESLGTTTGSATVCQAGETLPSGVSAIRLGLEASFGPRVLMRAYSGGRVVAVASRSPNWTGSSVTLPLAPLDHALSPVKLCFHVPANSGRLQLYGAHVAAAKAARGQRGEALPGRVSVEYLAPAAGSWWSRASSLARHMGIGHAIGGASVALLVLLLMLGTCGLVVRLAWRELP
jgi:hypothetical protein